MKFILGLFVIIIVLVVIGSMSNDDTTTPAPTKTEVQRTAERVSQTLNQAKQDDDFAENAGYEIVGRSGVWVSVLVKKENASNAPLFKEAASRICRGKPICKVQFWGSGAPTGMPMSETQANSMLASYSLNKNTGRDRWLYKCERFENISREQCM